MTECIRCSQTFDHEIYLHGNRKYCNDCKVLQHREESKLYQRELRLHIKKSQLAWAKGGI